MPSGVFTNRQTLSTSRSKAFAPLAEQRWITTTLAYLREMDLIAAKRQEFVPGGRPFRSFVRSNTGSQESTKSKQQSQRKRKECKRELSGRGGGAVTSPEQPGAGFKKDAEGQEPNPLTSSITFDRWLLCFPRWILRAQSSFAWNLRRSFTAEWCRVSAPSTYFSVACHPGCFDSSDPGLSRARLRKLARRRFLHCTVMALNYLFLGRFPSRDEIGRRPNAWQCGVFDRLTIAYVSVW